DDGEAGSRHGDAEEDRLEHPRAAKEKDVAEGGGEAEAAALEGEAGGDAEEPERRQQWVGRCHLQGEPDGTEEDRNGGNGLARQPMAVRRDVTRSGDRRLHHALLSSASSVERTSSGRGAGPSGRGIVAMNGSLEDDNGTTSVF